MVSQLLPYLLGGGSITAIIAALRWGRQDAKDSVEAAASNTTTAIGLRDEVLKDLARTKLELAALQDTCVQIRVELSAMHIENARLMAIVRRAGLDPSGPPS